MKYFQYIENTLPQDTQDFVEEKLAPEGSDLPFYIRKSQTPADGIDIPWLSHYIIIDGKQNSSDSIVNDSTDICNRVLANTDITCDRIIQSRICMYLQSNLSNHVSGKHVDKVEGSNYTIIYYVNDNDGGTIFYDDSDKETCTIPSKKGCAIVFDSSMKHAVLNPNKSLWRAVINYNIKGTKHG